MLEAMEIASDTTRIGLAAFHLEGEGMVELGKVLKGSRGNDLGRVP